jgi:hypothetical protein
VFPSSGKKHLIFGHLISSYSQSLDTTGVLTNVDKLLRTELVRGIQQENPAEKLKRIILLKKGCSHSVLYLYVT